MFEDMTFETILAGMLGMAAAEFSELDTREGSLIYTALAPAAVEINNLYLALDTALEMSYADTASRDYLIRRCAERGIVPQEATFAVIEAQFTPESVAVSQGTRFRCGAAVYALDGVSEEGYPLLTCETAGTVGNISGGSLVPVSYVEGLKTAVVRALTVPGQNVEDTEALRQRYMESYRAQAFGGNIADYREKVLAIDGVGGVRVFPAPDGPGTVGVGIIGADFAPPSATLVSTVQQVLDPLESSSQGRGLAPIGHYVTVSGVAYVPIEVTTSLTLEDGASASTVAKLAEAAVEAYFLELRAGWDDGDVLTVRVSQVDTRLLDVGGVLDVAGTQLNGIAGNLSLEAMEVPGFSGLTIS